MPDYLTEYNPAWPGWFLEIEHTLRPQLTDCFGLVHVGSTSLVGVPAKPIIDIDIVVPDRAMEAAIATIQQAGYRHLGDRGVTGREAFEPAQEATQKLPPHRLYACEASSPELRKHVSLREYLRAHPSEAQRLAELKRELVFRQKLSRSEYIAAKAPLVRELTAQALAWYELRHGV